MTDNKNDIKSALLSVGAHFGFGRSRRHATTKKRILGNKNGTDIIDIEQTALEIERASAYMAELVKEGKTILFVGTKPEIREILVKAADTLSMPYVQNRWSGGILTNWSEIKKRIEKRNALIKDKETGAFEKYTKKERMILNNDLRKMSDFFGGMENMSKLPDALFVIDPRQEDVAVKEAIDLNIPVISILNTDCSMKGISYPIVANDASRQSVSKIVSEIVATCRK
ncbi:30S ribosomal protein S2 [Candidatus Nomurabacteria bacterium]|nr:30S ribosomal protein S2 [Candidatus Nomurabacteria bacterium]MCB9820714.1 30S ribosomal protein S2 [Candidatus Nomurabacteria bacterium]